MNLHGIVSGAIGTVNPHIAVSIQVSTGATEDSTGRSVPAYAEAITTTGQKQELTGKDIFRLQQQNVQAVHCKLYLDGNYEGLFRVLGKGGDLITMGGHKYLVGAVLERWPDWCALALVMQLDAVT